MRITLLACALLLTACAAGPKSAAELENERADAAAKRASKLFDACMDQTLPHYGPVSVATADQRIRAAEACKAVMAAGSPGEPARPSAQ